MWLFTVDGFFSAVKHEDNDSIMIRSRVKNDLENLKKKINSDTKILSDAGTDYPYRIFIARDLWQSYLKKAVEDLDYCNFKKEIREGFRMDAYHDVWSILRQGLKKGYPDFEPDNKVRQENARIFAEGLRPTLEAYIKRGFTEQRIVAELNNLGIKGRRGGEWSLEQAQRVLERLGLKTRIRY
jgi:hypothetical protein